MSETRPARVAVVVFPGSQDDRDAALALETLGAEATLVWHGEAELPAVAAVVLPGYMALMGLGTAFLKDIEPFWYIVLITPVSFLHYSYDAIIWKLRKPQVAAALHVEGAR